MKFYSDSFLVPELLQADKFIFRPLRGSDVELDYDAVMSSSDMLRAWSQSDWPRDGFTLEENLEDLQRHEQEHLEKKAFTYTIMNPEETFCLGCIYLNPLLPEELDLVNYQHPVADEEAFAASVRYWIRESHASKEFNTMILERIIHWLDREWRFNCVVFPVAMADSMQTKLFDEVGLSPAGNFTFEPQNSYWNIYQKTFR
jgi:RimJ/RimL family protein N-acetyltransferase